MVGAAFAAPIAVLIGPPCHLDRVNRLTGQRGNHNSHGSWPAAIPPDMVGAIRLIGIAFIQLVEINDICCAIGKAHIAKSCNGVGGGSVLEQAVAKKQAEIFRIIFR